MSTIPPEDDSPAVTAPAPHPVHGVLDEMDADMQSNPASFSADVMAWLKHKIEVIRSML